MSRQTRFLDGVETFISSRAQNSRSNYYNYSYIMKDSVRTPLDMKARLRSTNTGRKEGRLAPA